MCSRGIYQLKAVDIFFCKHGGSSKGTRHYLLSSGFEALKDKNPQITFNVFQRNGNHPYITSKYINGYIKDIPLRNADPQEVEHMITKARNSFGRKALSHAGPKVFSTKPSIQGTAFKQANGSPICGTTILPTNLKRSTMYNPSKTPLKWSRTWLKKRTANCTKTH